MKNNKFRLGLVLMVVGVVLSAGSSGSTGTTLMVLGVVLFLIGLIDIKKEKANKK